MCLDNCKELEWTCQTTSRYQNDFSEMTGNAEILRISKKTRFFQSTELLWKCLKNCKVFTQPKSYWHVQNRVVQSVEKVLSSQNQYFPRTKAIFWHVFFSDATKYCNNFLAIRYTETNASTCILFTVSNKNYLAYGLYQ